MCSRELQCVVVSKEGLLNAMLYLICIVLCSRELQYVVVSKEGLLNVPLSLICIVHDHLSLFFCLSVKNRTICLKGKDQQPFVLLSFGGNKIIVENL